ncbi:MAG: hypothetical protein A2043_10675, partial [Candidatus Schekmanbacteria bacterium GWA2_38_9]
KRNADFTLVTPFVTNKGIKRLIPLLKRVSELELGEKKIEVVFNDWGVLRLLRREYKELVPVMGRMLNKMKRGPRLMAVINHLPKDTVEYYQSVNLDVPEFVGFLKENRIERVEFDNVLQDINFNFLSNGITVSLYLPFAYVSTTRFCLANSCDIPEKLEQVGIYPCRKECQRYTFLLQNPAMPVPLVRKGNTIFFKNEFPPKGFNEANISRVVIEPEIPM